MTDFVEIPAVSLLHEQVESIVLLEHQITHVVSEVVKELDVLEINGIDVLEDAKPEIIVITEGTQGPPGPQGAPGQAGVAYVTFKARGAIGGHRVVCAAFSGGARYADSRDVAGASSVLGLSLHAAEDGDDIHVANSGAVVEPSWCWAQDLPIFVGVEGVLTQVPPDTGFQLVVAVATSPNSAQLSIKQPIVI